MCCVFQFRFSTLQLPLELYQFPFLSLDICIGKHATRGLQLQFCCCTHSRQTCSSVQNLQLLHQWPRFEAVFCHCIAAQLPASAAISTQTNTDSVLIYYTMHFYSYPMSVCGHNPVRAHLHPLIHHSISVLCNCEAPELRVAMVPVTMSVLYLQYLWACPYF